MLPPVPVAALVTAAVLLLMLVELQLSLFNEKALRAKGAVEPLRRRDRVDATGVSRRVRADRG